MNQIEERRYDRISQTLGEGNYHRLASAVGVTPQHISRFVRGLKGASFVVACSIADAAEVSMDDMRWFIGQNVMRHIRENSK